MAETNDAHRLRCKAEELRTLAEGPRSLVAQRTYLKLADEYEKLAERVERAWGEFPIPRTAERLALGATVKPSSER